MNFLYKIKLYIIFFFILFCFVYSNNYAENEKENNSLLEMQERFEKQIKKYTLSNGIRIILMQNKFSPTIACYLKVGVGSSNEPFDIAGTAHFLEHLLFKGNKKLGTINYKEEKNLSRTN